MNNHLNVEIMATWLVLHKKHSGYGDIVGETYEYPVGIANSLQIKAGDYIVFCLTKKSANNDKRLLGYGRIKELEPKPPLEDDPKRRGRLAAHLEDYHKFDPPLSFDDIGGDPRTNFTNSISRIEFDFGKFTSIEIAAPINDDFNEKQYFARTIRRGQPKLRESLLKAYNHKCAISGHGPESVLEACHIEPHSISGNNQLENGLLLRSDIHCLFDDALIKINPKTYMIEVDDSIIDSPYGRFHGQELHKRIDGTFPSKKYLNTRYKG
ncbi:HNH endonuclease [Maribacter sp. TH_r10]|uniref:HNH endonuclease n=1 Tax=Maribacter sp. TH_r10 TaxID=3082086 RepID=UPI0029538D39|nr:HNH endonuclease [Maribacter sp. TH_r10]MDV7138249.1 HNH endonuclease [Maribacter sp. TH_r10]